MVYLTYYDADIDEEAVAFYDDGRWLNDKYKSNIPIFSPPELKTASIIFLVVNNNSDVSLVGGGTHWSLLVYVREMNVFFQYDSYKSMNKSKAKYVAKTIFGLDKIDIIETNAPQQMNECGVFVLSFVEYLYRKLIKYQEKQVKEQAEKQVEEKARRRTYPKELFEIDSGEIPKGFVMRKKCKDIISGLKKNYDASKAKK
ncbi:5424_t:CDS:2 [Diversispora eburnea]|uniref:5424_t:CDS:1 n=1 Tax=Diversispora eburnea TaxID=1213867 RepID=A0A9N8WFP3_9GLOM|nr:5424_t:CDS:2 [Diversispora eburnea]